MIRSLRRRSLRGFTRSEAVVLLALTGIVALFAVTYLRTISRHERLLRNVRDVQFLLVSSRDSAIKRHLPVVVWFDLKGRRIVTWVDQVPNFVQDPSEPTLREYRFPTDSVFHYAPGGEPVDGPSAVCFDGYRGNPSLVDRVIFRDDGTLLPPELPECGVPRAPRHLSAAIPAGSIDCNPGNRCRGIYLSDNPRAGFAHQNAFRVAVDDPGQTGAVTILKWLPVSRGGNTGETDYVPPPWKWTDG
jgi:hypothetical protein